MSCGEKERECTDLEFPFWFSFAVLNSWFQLHSSASSVKPLFWALSKMGAVIFVCLYIFVACVHYRLYLLASMSQLTLKPELSPYFCLMSERGHICVQYQRRIFGTVFIHLWLADLQRVLWPDSLWSADCFFLLFSSLFPSPEIIFITWTYHIMIHLSVGSVCFSLDNSVFDNN